VPATASRRQDWTRDLDENTQVDFDERGGVCAMTIEHASERADLPALDYEQVAA
jgi:uncharacterized protein YuzE